MLSCFFRGGDAAEEQSKLIVYRNALIDIDAAIEDNLLACGDIINNNSPPAEAEKARRRRLQLLEKRAKNLKAIQDIDRLLEYQF
jgi:hypothetical protein